MPACVKAQLPCFHGELTHCVRLAGRSLAHIGTIAEIAAVESTVVPLANAFIVKREVSVQIALRGAEPEELTVFLHSRAALHPGAKRPSELLLNDDPFLTVKGGDGTVRFINKNAIAWMTVARELEMSGRCESDAQLAMDRCTPIDVTLDDGRIFIGEVSILLPQATSRLQDYLNGAERFFEVRDARAIHFVNRDCIVLVKATE